jgi:hypothetical protein
VNADLLDAAAAAAAVSAWAGAYAGGLLLTRPAAPRPAPATPDLGDEPPAVVSLLANRWDLTEDAVESTLLDLAARGRLELRQPAADAMQTTVHVKDAGATGLAAYERRVLDRVCGLAVGGVVPVTALTFRDESQAKAWTKRLRAEVVADARRRGLSRRRFTPTIVAVLVAIAAVAAVVATVAYAHHAARTAEDDGGNALGVGFGVFLVLAALSSRYNGERDTAAGRQVAARWLGVRDWLRGHEAFADLPPAAVAVWDRYLGYGAALGVTRTASAVLDLGMGDRRLVWSSFGGTWHRVKVRYPRIWPRYGRPARHLVLRSLLWLAAGAALVVIASRAGRRLAGPDPTLTARHAVDLGSRIALLLGLMLLAVGGYQLLRTLLDLATPRTVTGEVLWREVWRSSAGGEDRPPVPWLHYLAVDDGPAERTTAWGLPSGLAGRCQDGDLVRITVRPWSRRVIDLAVLEPGRSRRLTESTVDADTEKLVTDLLRGAGGTPSG